MSEYFYIRNVMSLDVCIRVYEITAKDGGFQVNGDFVNMGFVESFDLGEPVNLFVLFKDLGNWQIFGGEEKCLRNANWKLLKT